MGDSVRVGTHVCLHFTGYGCRGFAVELSGQNGVVETVKVWSGFGATSSLSLFAFLMANERLLLLFAFLLSKQLQIL